VKSEHFTVCDFSRFLGGVDVNSVLLGIDATSIDNGFPTSRDNVVVSILR